ncbi:MAG: META domain-containing protein [Pikeienuella sp.]
MKRLLILLALLLAAGAAPADQGGGPGGAEARRITGEAAYRERIALIGEATLHVEYRNAAGAFYSSVLYRMDGAQIPFPFEIMAPDEAGTLSAEIAADGAVRFSSGPVAIPAGEDDFEAGVIMLTGGPQETRSGETGAEPDFHARGFEPDWSLAFIGDRIALTTDSGRVRREAALPAPQEDAGAAVYVAQALGASIRIGNAVCASGDVLHSKTVELTGDGWRLSGCGGAPISFPIDRWFAVESIGGGGMIDGSYATMHFSADGRIFGYTGCNLYGAPFAIDGERLSIGRATTNRNRGVCAAALSEQERRFIDMLALVHGYELGPDGRLILTSETGEALIHARRD